MSKRTNSIAASTIGIDTGKNTLHMIGLDEKGVIVLREKVSRSRIAARLVNMQPCLVGIEAGMATHYMARELVALGHVVKQVPPAFAADRRSDSSDQPASRLSPGARHCCTPRTSLLATAAATDRGHPHRCFVAPHGPNHWRPHRGLGTSR